MPLYRVLYAQTEFRNGWVEAESARAVREVFAEHGVGIFTDTEFCGAEEERIIDIEANDDETRLSRWSDFLDDIAEQLDEACDPDPEPRRFVLVEKNRHSGARWVSDHDSEADAVAYHDGEYHTIEYVLDLDTGEENHQL